MAQWGYGAYSDFGPWPQSQRPWKKNTGAWKGSGKGKQSPDSQDKQGQKKTQSFPRYDHGGPPQIVPVKDKPADKDQSVVQVAQRLVSQARKCEQKTRKLRQELQEKKAKWQVYQEEMKCSFREEQRRYLADTTKLNAAIREAAIEEEAAKAQLQGTGMTTFEEVIMETGTPQRTTSAGLSTPAKHQLRIGETPPSQMKDARIQEVLREKADLAPTRTAQSLETKGEPQPAKATASSQKYQDAITPSGHGIQMESPHHVDMDPYLLVEPGQAVRSTLPVTPVPKKKAARLSPGSANSDGSHGRVTVKEAARPSAPVHLDLQGLSLKDKLEARRMQALAATTAVLPSPLETPAVQEYLRNHGPADIRGGTGPPQEPQQFIIYDDEDLSSPESDTSSLEAFMVKHSLDTLE